MVLFCVLSYVRTPTKQLFVIKLFDNHCCLKKSAMWTCLLDVWSDCKKGSVLALGPLSTGPGFGFGFVEVEAHTRKSHRFCGIRYVFMACF